MENSAFGIKNELDTFHRQLNKALDKLKDTVESDKAIFSDLKSTIEISNNAVKRIEDIYNISEDLKVFAINSIVYSQKEGARGKGYQIISSRFISLSEDIAKGTVQINQIGKKMNEQISKFLLVIGEYEKFNREHIQAVSKDSKKLMEISGKSVENFSMILGDLLNRIEAIKTPTMNIMVQMQNQDIIQQQMDHMAEILVNIVKINEANSELLGLNPEEIDNPDTLWEYRNINTLLIFLLKTTEKQMVRINDDLLKAIDHLEIEFNKINNSVKDVDSDKQMISNLVRDETNGNSEATVIHLIFEAPKNTIESIVDNLDRSRKQKREIISLFKGIYDLVISEKSITGEFIPVIQSINNLLLLARIEQARNNLNISNDLSGDGVFSQTAFSNLEGIIEDMDNSGEGIRERLETVIRIFEEQKIEYGQMEEDLNDSTAIIENTESLFTENFNSVMQITDLLSREIHGYSMLFASLRELHGDMYSKINICKDMHMEIEKKLIAVDGPLSINECTYKDTTIQEILEQLTVEEERTTIAGEYSELDIEKSTGSSITLF